MEKTRPPYTLIQCRHKHVDFELLKRLQARRGCIYSTCQGAFCSSPQRQTHRNTGQEAAFRGSLEETRSASSLLKGWAKQYGMLHRNLRSLERSESQDGTLVPVHHRTKGVEQRDSSLFDACTEYPRPSDHRPCDR